MPERRQLARQIQTRSARMPGAQVHQSRPHLGAGHAGLHQQHKQQHRICQHWRQQPACRMKTQRTQSSIGQFLRKLCPSWEARCQPTCYQRLQGTHGCQRHQKKAGKGKDGQRPPFCRVSRQQLLQRTQPAAAVPSTRCCRSGDRGWPHTGCCHSRLRLLQQRRPQRQCLDG